MSNTSIASGAKGQGTDQERLSWRGSSPLAPAARQRLVEAASGCIAREGLEAASMAMIAAEAGVSRATVYRYFSSREALVGQALLEAAAAIRGKIRDQIRGCGTPADMIVEAVVCGLALIREDPVLHAVSGALNLGGFVSARIDPQGIVWTRETLALAIEAAGWSEPETDSAIEFVLRIFFSLASSPSRERSDDELRAFLYRHLAPAVGLEATDEP